MIKNKNGKRSTWAMNNFSILAFDKIKEHCLNEKQNEAEQLESQQSNSMECRQEQLF